MGQSQISVPFFDVLHVLQLKTDDFDAAINTADNVITAVFFWGHDCPNCEVAKKMLFQDAELIRELNFKWYHINVYEHADLGTRFGLHGIPTFLFFYLGKKLGRISPFPGMEPFLKALMELSAKHLRA